MDFQTMVGISCLLLVAVGLQSGMAQFFPGGHQQYDKTYPPKVKAIVKKVEKYLDAKQNRLDLHLSEDSSDPLSGLREMNYPEASRLGPIFWYDAQTKDGRIHISISFKQKVGSSSTVQELQNSVRYVSLDDLPMPGFKYPPGWEITPKTPRSSIYAGIKIVSFQNGRLHFTVNARFFEVYGRKPTVPVIADASAKRGTYFSVKRDIRGLIDVDMPLVFLQSRFKNIFHW